MARLKERGAKRAVRLPVSAPFHCELMAPAQERLAADLERLEFKDLDVPLVSNVDARPIGTGQEARRALVRQVTSSVRWVESVELLIREGAEGFLEIGPGKVLSGLLRGIRREARAYNVEDGASLAAAREALAAG
jgi:[acyl-carrier-protein] S-malonyltransferase